MSDETMNDWDDLETPSAERWRRDLETDRAMGLDRALEHGGFDPMRPLPEGVWRASREVSLAHRVRCTRMVTYLCRDAATAMLGDWALRHLAGLAEARLRLRVDAPHWTLTALDGARRDGRGRWDADCIPDAIWRASWGDVALEYDAGSHRLSMVAQKARRYRRDCAGQVWLAATAERQSGLARVLEQTLPERWTWRTLRVEGW